MILLDVKSEPWIVENRRDILILSTMALVAISLIVIIFIWVKRRRKKV